MSNYRQSSVIDDFKIHSKFLSKKYYVLFIFNDIDLDKSRY